MKKENECLSCRLMKMASKYYLQLVFLIALFFGAIQPSYAIDLGGVGVEKVVEKSAVGTIKVKAWDALHFGGVDDIIRTNTDALTKVDDYFKKYPNKVDDFKAELKAATDKTDYLRKLGIIKHPNWISISDIPAKVLAKKPHVLTVENLTQTRNYTPPGSSTSVTLEGFTGMHTKQALIDYTNVNGGTYSIKNASTPNAGGAYQGQPVITINGKDYVKVNGTKVEYEPGKYGGTSSLFPDSWDVPKVLEEVEHAVKNNHGLVPGTNNTYRGYSSDGKVEIHFYYNVSNGNINSYFPKI